MAKTKTKTKIFQKIIILLVLSCMIHFLYDWFGFDWLTLFAPTSESLFQHMRIFFTAYLLYSLFEYNFIYKTVGYWTSRFLLVTLIPWVMAMIYLLPQSFTGKIPTELLEVFWSISSTILVWSIIIPLEKDLEKVRYSQSAKIIIALLLVLIFLTSLVFTFNLPVYDIFAQPVTLY